MKYTPKELKGNVNVSETHPVREFFLLVAGVAGVCLLIYWILGFAVDLIVARLPSNIESGLGRLVEKQFRIQSNLEPRELYLTGLVNRLKKGSALEAETFSVHVADEEQVNALAMPGNHILVYSGLLKLVESENELAMVLGHELGHFAHKDHLRGLGRGLVLLVVSSVVLGANSSATDFIQTSLLAVNMKFSQKQESQADAFGLDRLHACYGHAGGATGFFEKLERLEHLPGIVHFFSSHPSSEDRIAVINRMIADHGLAIKSTAPIDTEVLGDTGTVPAGR